MTLKVHSVVQDSHDFNRCFWGHPVHQEVTAAPTMSCNVDSAKTWRDFISRLGACNIGTLGKFADRLNERLLIDTRLSSAKIFGGPFYNIRKVEFCDGAEANAPLAFCHRDLPGSLGDDLLREVVQIGLQVFGISEFFEFASIQCTSADSSRRF